MKKILLIASIFIVLSLMLFGMAHAAGGLLRKGFGGKITKVESQEIQRLTNGGFICEMTGTTFDIRPVGKNPTGPYIIPISLSEKIPSVGKWIMGRYNKTTTVIATCTNEADETEQVQGYTVTSYATSRLF